MGEEKRKRTQGEKRVAMTRKRLADGISEGNGGSEESMDL